MAEDQQFDVRDAEAMETLGERIAAVLEGHGVVFLTGELGAGKTTLVRGALRHLGHRGAVKSPTFTLVEPYEINDAPVYHFDLYRLGDPEELEYVGIRDYLDSRALCFVEWPERGLGALPAADLEVRIRYRGAGRRVIVRAGTGRGAGLLRRLADIA